MDIRHPQENIIKTYDYNGIAVDLVEWSDSVWCGKAGYADKIRMNRMLKKLWRILCRSPHHQTAVKIIGISA